MEVSYEKALAVCSAHYAEKGVVFYPHSPEEVFRIYGAIQKEIEDRKRIKIEEERIGGLTIRKTYLIDDTDPTVS